MTQHHSEFPGISSTLRRIVAGVDFSETGDAALRESMQIARRTVPSELHVVYVIKTPRDLHDARKLDSIAAEIRQKVDELRDHVEAVCAPLAEQEGAFGQELVFHVRIGSPAEALHQVAVDVDADLLVVGTHGRRGMEKLLLGSVAEDLVRMARLPVLIAHPKDFVGLRHSDRPEPARPGEDIHDTQSLTHRVHLEFQPRNQRISGLL